MTLRTAAAVAAGKLTRVGLQTLGRGATALPGLVTLTLDPAALSRMTAGFAHGSVLVSGTNGKTTTSRMLADVVRAAGWAPVHNRSGSNLDRGIAAALIERSDWLGSPEGDVGVFEVDEASVPRVLSRLVPRVVIVTNLFRDQLDRYFELAQLARRIAAAVAELGPDTTLVLNADDPIVVQLGSGHAGRTIFFGIDDPAVGGKIAQHISDATHCPRCSTRLWYSRVILGHVGDWSCPGCGFARPAPEISATRVELSAGGSLVHLAAAASAVLDPVRVPLPGLYNAYNALAAIGAARALDISLPTAARAIASVRPAFGRLEIVEAEGRRLRLVLVKNPAGFNAAIAALLEQGGQHRLLAALNDRDADGRDVSWIWDADFEALVPAVEHAVVTGLRARDLALRFKYAGLPRDRLEVAEGWGDAIRRAIEGTPIGGEAVVLTTYTALLALRQELFRLGHVRQFWED